MSEQAGRELDALVAEKVMGFKLGDEPVGDEIHEVYRAPNGRGYYHYQIPHYSTSIAAAWEVVPMLDLSLEQFWSVVRFETGFEFYANPFQLGDYPAYVEAETLPLLLCLAALKAVQAP